MGQHKRNPTAQAAKISTVNVKLLKKDKSWKIQMEKGLQDALSGGLVSVSKEISKELPVNKLSESDSPTPSQSDTLATQSEPPIDKVSEIYNFVVDEMWNNGFCDISFYLDDGTGSVGQKIDITSKIAQIRDSYKKKKAYDEYIKGLNAEQFSNIKNVWDKLSIEIDVLYNQIISKKPVPKDRKYTFDTGKFSQYMEDFNIATEKLQ